MSNFILTADNYYTPEANQAYLSVSQFKDFNGTYGRFACEAHALAKQKGEWQDEETTALLVGGFVDCFYEKTLDKFKAEHEDIFTKETKNNPSVLKAPYRQAEIIIERTLKDKKFQDYMSGEKQVIMTAEMFGAPWKIKIDSYHAGKAIVDLKVMQSIYDAKWVRDVGSLDFIRYWNYDIQGAVYQRVVEIVTGKRLPFYLAVATKSDHPQIRIIQIPQEWLNDGLSVVEANTPRILQIKNGEIEPDRCEQCDYCNDTYEIDKPISAMDLLEGY
jgi:hypothetical protein